MFLYIAVLISVVSLHGMSSDENGFIWILDNPAWNNHNNTLPNFNVPVSAMAPLRIVGGDTALMNTPIWKSGARLLPTNRFPINGETPSVTITSETAKKKLVSKKSVYDGAFIDSHDGVKKATAKKGFQRGGQKRRRNVGKAEIGKFQQKKKRS